MKSYILAPDGAANGDNLFIVRRAGDAMFAGRVRYNPRTSDWHASLAVRGKLRSRYFSTESGAARWVLRTAGLLKGGKL